jgi:multiple sugar transport system permease protein
MPRSTLPWRVRAPQALPSPGRHLPKTSFRRVASRGSLYFYLLPAAVLLGLAVGYPLVSVVLLAFRKVNQFGIPTGWAGWSNFVGLWNSGFPEVIQTTVIWTFGILVPTIIFSLVLAWALASLRKAQAAFRSLVLIPWAIPLAIVAVLARLILQTSYGTFNDLLRALGISNGVAWLATAGTSLPIMVLIGIWVSVPFTALTLLSGIYAIPSEIHEAALLDAPSALRRFIHVTLPLLRNPLQLVVIINLAYIFNSFPIIWILTQGGPAETTATSTTFVYQLAFTDGQFGFAGAAGLLSLFVLIGVTILYVSTYRRSETSLLSRAPRKPA